MGIQDREARGAALKRSREGNGLLQMRSQDYVRLTGGRLQTCKELLNACGDNEPIQIKFSAKYRLTQG